MLKRVSRKFNETKLLYESFVLGTRRSESECEIDNVSVGDRLLDCTIVRKLGRGVESRVFLCRQATMGDRLVVAKVSYSLKREAALLGRLSHPCVTPVHAIHVDEALGADVMLMPFLGTQTLHELNSRAFANGVPADSTIIRLLAKNATIRRSAKYVDSMVAMFAGIAEALELVHESGFIHGDIKPQNILIGKTGALVLIDFHLSTSHGRALNGRTLRYSAPEVRSAAGLRVAKPRSEVYSLAAVLSESLTGELIQDNTELSNALSRTQHLHPRVVRVVQSALSQEIEDRPTMRQFCQELKRISGLSFGNPNSRRQTHLFG